VRRGPFVAFLCTMFLTVGVACDGGGDEAATEEEAPAFVRSEADTVAEYVLVDFAFQGPTEVLGPKVLFTADNTGTQEHELEILDSTGAPVGEIAAFSPDEQAEPFAAELRPGAYTLQCILETPDGKVHKDLGMVANLTVT
jgi:hypothetical protein